MPKFDGILICTDLDGTLYRNDKSISRENREAIEYFKREGGYFTFVTGRMPYYSMDAYRAIAPNVPFGCINGGGLYDGAAQKYVGARTLDRRVCDLIQCIDDRFPKVGIQVCCLEKSYFAKETPSWVRFRRLTGLPNLVRGYREVDEPIAKIIFGTDDEEEMQAIQKTLAAHPASRDFSLVRSEKTLFEILPRGVNKGVALAMLTKHLDIDPQRTVAIGDYDNDVAMLRAAGLGVAVANASSAALAAADLVTVSNEEHAIARVIYECLPDLK